MSILRAIKILKKLSFKIISLLSLLIIIRCESCLVEFNPPEEKRIYSSIWESNSIGKGYARSMLDSDQAWSAGSNDMNQWMIIDLDQEYKIQTLVLQARKICYFCQYVSKVEIFHSKDGIDYIFENGELFETATSESNRYYYKLDKLVDARYIKIHPMQWNDHISMRAGVLVYFDSQTKCNANNKYYYLQNVSYYSKCDISCSSCEIYFNKCTTCANGYFPLDTDESSCFTEAPSGYVFDQTSKKFKIFTDSELNPPETNRKYSSVYDKNTLGTGHARSMLDSPQAWSALNNIINEWIQIDLGEELYLSGIVVQGRKECCVQYVTQYKVKVSNDETTFEDIGDFIGTNANNDVRKYSYFNNSIKTRYVRLYILTWVGHISIRVGVLKYINKNYIYCNKDNYKLDNNNNSCVVFTSSPIGFYFDSKEKLHKLCENPCFECVDKKDKCLSCIENYYKKINEAICYHKDSIPNGYYIPSIQNNQIPVYVLPCDKSCKTCKSFSNKCNECSQDYYLKSNEKIYCFHKDSVPPGFYLPSKLITGQINYILPCDIGCKTCKEYSYVCTECNKEYYWKENEKTNCYHKDKIEDGFYLDISDNLLKKCNLEICSTCIENNKNCIKCRDNYYKIFNVEKLNIEKLKDAKNLCFDMKYEGFFLNTATKLLNRCDISCKICEKNSKYCLECAEEWFKKEEDLKNLNECFNKNDENKGFYLSDKLFKKCDDSCKTCVENKYKCIECNDDYYKFPNKELKFDLKLLSNTSPPSQFFDKIDFVCLIDKEIQGFFIDKKEKLYKNCPKGCESCNLDGCTLCNNKENFYFYEDDLKKCLEGNKPNYYLNDKQKTYYKCTLGCKTCSSKTNCLICDTDVGYY